MSVNEVEEAIGAVPTISASPPPSQQQQQQQQQPQHQQQQEQQQQEGNIIGPMLTNSGLSEKQFWTAIQYQMWTDIG